MSLPNPVDPPRVTLMGPGPSQTSESVLAALARPTLGHLDPRFLAIMDEIAQMLRQVFGTDNRTTLPISGTGSAGMETCVMNLVEPGDAVLVGVNGVFGGRLCEVASRAGGEVTRVEAPWGRAFSPEDFERAAAGRRFKVLCVVHAETSTGVLQDLSGLREVADRMGALLLVDTVTSLGGVPVELDRFGVDATYSGTQKCLSCPPGLSPVSFSDRAVDVIGARTSPVRSWYMDIGQLTRYWGGERAYHHTAPINMLYGLHEALRLCLVEGLPARFERHRLHARALAAGLGAMGLELPVPEAIRLPPLTLVKVGAEVDEAAVRRRLLTEHGMEIGGGLGDFKGKAWRIGLMGASSSRGNVEGCLSALAEALQHQGVASRGDGLAAAREVYASV
ncbi:MAG: alanine--glyoxylate aminotransferase family protein [Deltaproteobacteria bacterium]|nr:alanine--glyoxylate aminotransferase family protein [Deltaproteobacteria bacterium]MCB9788574.1 alanine--glyoxylate aminotransferase family protein [Deltaproteobacteria bacterium]